MPPGYEKTKKAFFDKNGWLVPVDTVVQLVTHTTIDNIECWVYKVIEVPVNAPAGATEAGKKITVWINQASNPDYIGK